MQASDEKNLNGYDRKASVLKKLKFTTLAILILVLLFFFLGYREDITIENIRYLLKYVDISPAEIGSADAQVIPFEADSSAITTLFRSDLVVVDKDEVSTYDMSAKKGISDTVSLASPTVSTGKKYFAVFDMGDNYYALYNSFSKIYEETTPYAIWDVVIGDNSEVLIVTAEKGYRSVLKVYNSELENKMNWFTPDKYIVSADIFSSRDTFYSVGCVRNNENGDFLSSLVVLKAGAEEVFSDLEIASELILKTDFFSNGNIAVLTDKAVRVVDLTGKVLSETRFSSESLRLFETEGEWSALVLNENSIGTEHRLIILDQTGNTSMDTVIDTDVRDLSVSESDVVILGTQKLISISTDKREPVVHTTDRSYEKAFALGDSKAVLIYDNNAYVVSVE